MTLCGTIDVSRMLPHSRLLLQVFPPPGEKQLEEEVELSSLAIAIIESTSSDSQLLEVLLRPTGTARRKMISVLLQVVAQYDSVVRDVLTTGHLAKILARYAYVSDSEYYPVLGLPNRVFDRMSQTERAEYFSKGNTLPLLMKSSEVVNRGAQVIRLEEDLIKSVQS